MVVGSDGQARLPPLQVQTELPKGGDVLNHGRDRVDEDGDHPCHRIQRQHDIVVLIVVQGHRAIAGEGRLHGHATLHRGVVDQRHANVEIIGVPKQTQRVTESSLVRPVDGYDRPYLQQHRYGGGLLYR